jgi:hypothetical protein
MGKGVADMLKVGRNFYSVVVCYALIDMSCANGGTEVGYMYLMEEEN